MSTGNATEEKSALEELLEEEDWLNESPQELMAKLAPELLVQHLKGESAGVEGYSESEDGEFMELPPPTNIREAIAVALEMQKLRRMEAEFEKEQQAAAKLAEKVAPVCPMAGKAKEGMAAIKQDVNTWLDAKKKGDEEAQNKAIQSVKERFAAMSEDIELIRELGENVGSSCFGAAENACDARNAVRDGLKELMKNPELKGTAMEDALASSAKGFFSSLRDALGSLQILIWARWI